ncbi:MAG: hypothetical protein M4579_000608 [Chaenotheca gracillima]|nr:MAG: hypothetical protein M4579_000608 [Chaenotheca gracillima]
MDLSWETGAPDGTPRKMVMVNGGFPAPQLFVDEGDSIEVTVVNHMPFNTTLHWHGIEQLNTPWADGVPGLSQKPIEPGHSFVYKFVASPYGTYWYHAHSRGNLQDGLYGALHIRPKPGTPSPFHLITNDTRDLRDIKRAEANPNLLLFSDWNHLTSWEYFDAEVLSGVDNFCMDSILTNGKGSVFCPGQEFLVSLETPYIIGALNHTNVTDKGCYPNIEQTQGKYAYNESLIPPGLESGCVASSGSNETVEVNARDGWASINLISATSLKTLAISIDEHPMWVYAVDGRYIEPQPADVIRMFNGERYSVLIKLDKKPGDYTIRVSDTGLDQIISGFATLVYKGGKDIGPSKPSINYGGDNLTADVLPLDITHLPPWPPVPVAETADAMHVLRLGRLDHAWEWTLDGDAVYEMDRSAYHPLLYSLNQADAKDKDLTIRTLNNTWVDIVLQVGWSPEQPIEFPHSMHKHANKASIIGTGLGIWNYTSTAEAIAAHPDNFDLVNPMYRDTFVTSFDGPSWVVIRYHVRNPGAWLFHCHIETHLEGGMSVALLDGVDHWPYVPKEYRN